MFVLSRKYEDFSNKLVDICKVLDGQNEIVVLLLTVSMNINKCICQLEKVDSPPALIKAQKGAFKEIDACEFIIEMLTKDGSITNTQSVSVLADCILLRNLIKSGQTRDESSQKYN